MKSEKKVEDFVPNNIAFRILSSKMIEKVKQAQSYVLSEIEYGDYKFNRTSKEVALLYTDALSDWLQELEKAIIKWSSFTEVDATNRDAIESSCLKRLEYIEDVCSQRDDLFNHKYIEVWKKVRFPVEAMIQDIVHGKQSRNPITCFTLCAQSIIDSIEELRLDLYEIDYYIENGEKPFICITDTYVDYLSKNDSRIITKAKIYMKEFGCEDFYLKNYTSSTEFFRRLSKIISTEIPIREKS